jgi:hypothetical protein
MSMASVTAPTGFSRPNDGEGRTRECTGRFSKPVALDVELVCLQADAVD